MTLKIGGSQIEKCATHGQFISFNLAGSTRRGSCPACHAERQAREFNTARKAAIAARGVTGIPLRFKGKSLDDFIVELPAQQLALDFAKEYVATFDENALRTGRSAIFVGYVGTAKTSLAAAVGEALAARGRQVLFTGLRALLRRIKSTWHPTAAIETEQQALDAFTLPDLLILDEIGVQFESETEQLLLYDVLNGRYENRRPSLLISNFDVGVVRECIGERSYDRLREDGGQSVVFDWESWRGRY